MIKWSKEWLNEMKNDWINNRIIEGNGGWLNGGWLNEVKDDWIKSRMIETTAQSGPLWSWLWYFVFQNIEHFREKINYTWY